MDADRLAGDVTSCELTLGMLEAAGVRHDRALYWLDAMRKAALEFQINTPFRLRQWIANVAHESMGLALLEENLAYSAPQLLAVWPSTPRRPWGFTPEDAPHYAYRPEEIANRVYANRMGNGNSSSGDGWLYRGRGPIQITGRDNYAACAMALDVHLLTYPDALKLIEPGARSAGWFWKAHHCNELADAGDIDGIRRAINGGEIGLDDVIARANAIGTVA